MDIRRQVSWLLLLVALTTGSGSAAADRPTDGGRVRQLVGLVSHRDYRVRVQACLSLGQVGGPGARAPLELALRDEQAAVRAAAAASLARLGDRAALPALRRASSDTAPVVRQQIDAAVRTLTRNAGEDWSAVKAAIAVGTMTNATTVRGDELKQTLGELVLAELRASDQVAVIPDPAPADLLAKLRRRRLELTRIDGTISRVTRQFTANGTVRVQADIILRLLSDPAREVRASERTWGTAEQSRDTFDRAAERRMQDRAMEAAIHSALPALLPSH